jgi:hypothetical protein
MGGTTEHAGNFVPVDERLVSFFVSQNLECRGQSPLPGCGAAHLGDAIAGPHKHLFTLAAAGGKKMLIGVSLKTQKRSAEDEVLCRGSGCPRKIPFSFSLAAGD